MALTHSRAWAMFDNVLQPFREMIHRPDRRVGSGPKVIVRAPRRDAVVIRTGSPLTLRDAEPARATARLRAARLTGHRPL